jgi:hypothetical protein
LKTPTECKTVSTSIKITNSQFEGTVNFSNCLFKDIVSFSRTTFLQYASFSGAAFSGLVRFNRAVFKKVADYGGVVFSRYVRFGGATFRRNVHFRGDMFSRNISFRGATFNRNADFSGVIFDKNLSFSGARFEGDNLTFRKTTFKLPKPQEEACRKAKIVLAKAGNRNEEEYHFYREMEAIRIQKGIRGNSGLVLSYVVAKTDTWSFWSFFFHDVIEYFFVQEMFGYGVHPKRLIISWGAIVLAFGFFYWYGDGIIGTTGWLDYIKVSFATAIAPGYIAAIINPGSAGYRLVPAYQMVAMIETIVGTFLWAGFIATFAKKYMR